MQATLPCAATWETRTHAARTPSVALPAAGLQQRGKGNDMAKTALLFNYEYCTGCQSCELACKNEHGFPMDKWGIKMVEFGPFEMEEGKLEWNYLPFPTSYCDMCQDRVNAGGIPTCALHCLANVIEWGPVEELSKKLEEKGSKAVIFLP